MWAEVVKHLRHPELIARACAATPDDTHLAETHRQLTELRTQHRRLVDAYQADAITLADLKARQGPLTERIAELDQATTRDRQQRITKDDLNKRIDDFAHQVNGNLEAMTFDQRQQLIRTVLDRVILTQERVELCFKIPIPHNRKEGRSRQSRVSDQLRSHRHTLRGDRVRSARLFIRSVNRVIDLEPETMITGHDEPIEGAARIRADLTRIRDATEYIHDETVKGMNAGKDLWTLMSEIKLPAHLEPARQGRGLVVLVCARSGRNTQAGSDSSRRRSCTRCHREQFGANSPISPAAPTSWPSGLLPA